jgi:hypothetical protein
MRPNRRWIAPAALTALAAATTTGALAEASAGPSKRAPNAVTAASTTAERPSGGAGAAGRANPSAAGAAAGNVQIAATTLGTGLRVTLHAYRVGAYDALVDVAAFRYARGAWRPAWHERVPGPWFYHPLTGENGVCTLSVTDRPGAAPTVDVSLLVSPSVGCSPVRHFTIR